MQIRSKPYMLFAYLGGINGERMSVGSSNNDFKALATSQPLLIRAPTGGLFGKSSDWRLF